MTITDKAALRLQFLVRVVGKESRHLTSTDQRLFQTAFTTEQVAGLEFDLDQAERVEAFVSRFSRLQDTVGDKLLPVLLAALGERIGAVMDNLDRAERLGWIASADEWMAMRNLRNQMVHEYVEDPEILAGALRAGHDFVQSLVAAADAMIAEAQGRGWA